MPPGQSALNVEIQVDTTALAAKLQAAVQAAVTTQMKAMGPTLGGGGSGGGGAPGAAGPSGGITPGWLPYPNTQAMAQGVTQATWAPAAWQPINTPLPSDASWGLLRTRARSVIRGGIRYGLTAGIIGATGWYLHRTGQEEDEISVIGELKKSLVSPLATGVSTSVLSGPSAGLLSGAAVLALETLYRAVEFFTKKDEYRERQLKELLKQSNEVERQIIGIAADLRDLDARTQNQIAIKSYEIESDFEDNLYEAMRAIPFN